MRVPRSVHPGATAEVTLDLPEQESVQLCAEVVRVDEPRSGMALRFVGDSDQNRRPLANFIMRQHATSR